MTHQCARHHHQIGKGRSSSPPPPPPPSPSGPTAAAWPSPGTIVLAAEFLHMPLPPSLKTQHSSTAPTAWVCLGGSGRVITRAAHRRWVSRRYMAFTAVCSWECPFVALQSGAGHPTGAAPPPPPPAAAALMRDDLSHGPALFKGPAWQGLGRGSRGHYGPFEPWGHLGRCTHPFWRGESAPWHQTTDDLHPVSVLFFVHGSPAAQTQR